MAKKLFVGGIPWATTSDDLQQLFSQHGTVASATVITDKMTGRSRGFGFVEFENDAEADAATAALNNSDYNGRTLVVKEARPLKTAQREALATAADAAATAAVITAAATAAAETTATSSF